MLSFHVREGKVEEIFNLFVKYKANANKCEERDILFAELPSFINLQPNERLEKSLLTLGKNYKSRPPEEVRAELISRGALSQRAEKSVSRSTVGLPTSVPLYVMRTPVGEKRDRELRTSSRGWIGSPTQIEMHSPHCKLYI